MRRRLALAFVAAALAAQPGRPSAQTPALVDLVNRYAHGKFADVAASLTQVTDFHALLNHLKQDAPAWIAAGSEPDDRDVRALTAATVALEAARVDEDHEWKLVQRYFRIPT